MLNVMRDNLKHLKWVLWIVAFAMVMYLGAYFFNPSSNSPSGQWIAKVNGETIGVTEFQQAARRQDDSLRRQLGQNYEMFRKQLRIGTQVADRLVNQRIMLAEARALGLEVSKAELTQAIHQQFADASGNFVGKEQYLAIIGQSEYGSAANFESQLRADLTVSKWAALMTEAASVSDSEMERLYRSRNEKAAFDYAFVAAGAQVTSTAVSDAELEAWYRSHADSYRRGEARKIRMLVVERQAQIAKSPVTDAEVKAFYDAHPSDFSRPEQRRATHILFKVADGTSDADKRSIHDLAQSVLLASRSTCSRPPG